MERRFSVDTPFGKLNVYPKLLIDRPQDHPGVYVDLEQDGKAPELLACVEYNSLKRVLQTCVYQPDVADEPVALVEHSLKKPRKITVPCDVAIKRLYRVYVEVDEGASAARIEAEAKRMIADSDNPDIILVPDPDLFTEIEEQDVCWVNPDWVGIQNDEEEEL